MIALKDYQQRVLDSLRDFLRKAATTGDPAKAFGEITLRQFREPQPHLPVHVAGLSSGMPYVCLRVPTGGGKTLLACHACGLAVTEYLEAERAIILWLVPSTTILDQTADALRDPRHPYRRALESACGSVEVLRISEALNLSRATADGKTVVIVSTIQAFRAEDPTGRKVHSQNSVFSEHLLNLPASLTDSLIKGADRKPKANLVNALRLRRPVVIVDEAHNARTDLSFAALADVRPSCIVEFTATPARKGHPSNVLHHVSAAELAQAEMVKLPLRVITRHPSQKDELLADALTLRTDLEKLATAEAQATGEYLRPILLIQAERVDACEPLRERMVSDYGLEKKAVIISTGTRDELKDIADIASPKCPVRVIITVEKLREGWDCPFAYVLCSLKETRSATAIEQIVGRILRLPGARKKRNPDLNCAYALSVSPSITEVLTELRTALEGNGFTPAEAGRIILPVSEGILPLGSQPQTITLATTDIDAESVKGPARNLTGKVRIDAAAGTITINVPLSDEETEQIADCLHTPEAKAKVRALAQTVREAERAFGGTGAPRPASPYERQLDFLVPLLSFHEGENTLEFESTMLREPWQLSAKDAALAPGYNPSKRPTGKAGTIDIGAKGKLATRVLDDADTDADFIATLHQETMAFASTMDWNFEALVGWIDKHIEHKDITIGESAAFIGKVIRGLMAKFEFKDVGTIALDRYRLRDEIAKRLQGHRADEREKAFRGWLDIGSPLEVTDAQALDFRATSYEPSWYYEGGHTFKKHYFGPRVGEMLEKTKGGTLTEEFHCAQFIDSLPEVEYWIRNLARKSTSFRLQTSTDIFYPDFVCKLTDGRILAIEYKGKHLFDGIDSKEKRDVGAVWESRSGGKCLFIMPTDRDFEAIARKIRGG